MFFSAVENFERPENGIFEKSVHSNYKQTHMYKIQELISIIITDGSLKMEHCLRKQESHTTLEKCNQYDEYKDSFKIQAFQGWLRRFFSFPPPPLSLSLPPTHTHTHTRTRTDRHTYVYMV